MCGVDLEKQEAERVERIFLEFAVQTQKQISTHFHKPRKKVIVLAGPTACGKSQFAILLAKQLEKRGLGLGEIISADPMQVYLGMDIGTAKVTLTEREMVPHHLIDIRPVTQPFNVVDFYCEARQCIRDIHSRSNIPIVVGGAGFYLHTLIYGPPAGPPSVPEVRQALEKEMQSEGAGALYIRLQQLDPQYAKTITKNDKQKIVRALEIISLTGKKVSQLSWRSRRKPQNYSFSCWFLHRPKEVLYKRIEQRCMQMLQGGLIEEVQRLQQRGLLQNSSASQAIGYRQALEYLASTQNPEDYNRLVMAFKQASRRYAKRQFTWFGNEPLFWWLDLELHDLEVAVDMIRKDYETQ